MTPLALFARITVNLLSILTYVIGTQVIYRWMMSEERPRDRGLLLAGGFVAAAGWVGMLETW